MTNSKLRIFLKMLILWLLGGFIYIGIEIVYRGFSHWTMFILGGLCFLLVGLLNEGSTKIGFIKQCFMGAAIITSLEFLFGVIFNIFLGLNVWDYSSLRFNLLGQICLTYAIAWIFLSGVAIVLDDWCRHLLFHEARPSYPLFNKIKGELNMKNIDWKSRVVNKTFWVLIIPALLLVVQSILAVFGISFDYSEISSQLIAIVSAVFTVLALLGVVVNPSTKGISDKEKHIKGKNEEIK